MMTKLVFEQPLNEKVRGYLRLEYLSEQLEQNLIEDQQHRCFEPLFSLCELCERYDYRSDVVKEIDKLLSSSVDSASLCAQNKQQLVSLRVALKQPGRLTDTLKQNRFLSALRQRLSMPGASCNFDLPQLHYWLAQPFGNRAEAYQQWISPFQPLLNSVKILLNIARNSADFQAHTADAGFYQGQAPYNLSLVRVCLDDQACYPTISGNRNRYAIHFVDFATQKHTDRKIEFKLAAC